MLITAAILAILALPLLILGLRGRKVDDHPVCRKCKFDLVGVFPETKVCPECGRDQTETAPRIGNRRKRWRIALIGCTAMFIATSLAGLGVWRAVDEQGWVRYAPTFMLNGQVVSSDAAKVTMAADELLRRLGEEGLKATKIRSAIDAVLDHQAEADITWLAEWGQFVEDARVQEAVSDEQWGRYAGGIIFDATLIPQSPVRLGEVVPFKVEFELRCSKTLLFPAKFLVMPASVNGVRREVRKVTGDDPWRAAHPGGRQFGYGSLWLGHNPTLSVTAPRRDPSPPPSSPYAWPAAMDLGDGIQTVQVHAYVFENPNFPRRNQSPRALVPEIAIAKRTFNLEAQFTVVDADASTVTLVTDPARAPNLSHRSTQVVQQQSGKWRCQGQLNVPAPPTGLAFDVFWRAGDREWALGSITRTQGGSSTQWHYYYGTFDDFDPAQTPMVDIILRPSEAAARRVPGMTEIWGQEIIIKDVLIEGPDLP